MQSAKQSIGAYGAASAIFSGVIACAFVVGASIYGEQLADLIGDLSCGASRNCAAPVAGGAAPVTNDSAEQLSAELPAIDEPPAVLPATAMQTTTR